LLCPKRDHKNGAKLKKSILLIFILFLTGFSGLLKAQDKDSKALFQKFVTLFNAGDFVNAENCLLLLLNSKNKLSEQYLVAVYNGLGATSTQLGNYTRATEYYSSAEAAISDRNSSLPDLADIFINKAIIYANQKSYQSSIEYFEKGIRIYNYIKKPDKSVFYRISTAYLNTGIIYFYIEDYKTALNYLRKSIEIKQKHNLSEIAFVYLNIAKTCFKLKRNGEAGIFFQKSIESSDKEFVKTYFRLAEIYFGYGLFLRSIGRNAEALEFHKRALSICLLNYGEKHTYVSLSYKHIGDDYFTQNNFDSALYYYQKSLIAVVKNFNDPGIFTNPSIDSSLFDIRLLDNLKSKAKALELFAGNQNDPALKHRAIGKSLETIELALKLIDRIRNNYMTEESRIYLAENEKETYLFATHIANTIYSTTRDKSMGYKMYGMAQKAKAAILRNEITGNELLYSTGVPDSLRVKQNNLSVNIAAYNNMILEESRKTKPDTSRIGIWKDALFEMNREKEKVNYIIEKVFPQYHDLIRKIEPDSLQLIQKQLKKDEIIIDYLLSNQYTDGNRKLYIFLISREHLEFRESRLDSLFIKNAEIIRTTTYPSNSAGSGNHNFNSYTGALNYMYINLIKPVEKLFVGNRLIIIPDEEIGWLPFDAFLKDIPLAGQTDYEGLHYLINDYIFSYGYSSSLIFSKSKIVKKGAKVFTFSPDYSNTTSSDKPLSLLQGGDVEIESVFNWFSGKNFSGENATKANFIKTLGDPAIFHLAMHSMSDSANSKYSYLVFDTHNLPSEAGKLYNYEISLTRIKSPMIVLSACNSGSGTLYHGEGLMSLARGFTLAGASSVIKTAWEINDEASAGIITRFYRYLSKGKEKNEAMRLAKLEYLKESPPEFTNPYYWAAYEVLGDNTPIAVNNKDLTIIIACLVVIITELLFYFKRRNIFAERSR
jgi:CHAT domain-containing protein